MSSALFFSDLEQTQNADIGLIDPVVLLQEWMYINFTLSFRPS